MKAVLKCVSTKPLPLPKYNRHLIRTENRKSAAAFGLRSDCGAFVCFGWLLSNSHEKSRLPHLWEDGFKLYRRLMRVRVDAFTS